MAETDSDTTLGLEEKPFCRQRTSPTMNTSSSLQKKYDDDSPATKWIQTPDVNSRRYKIFLFFVHKKEQNKKEMREGERENVIVRVNCNSFYMQ